MFGFIKKYCKYPKYVVVKLRIMGAIALLLSCLRRGGRVKRGRTTASAMARDERGRLRVESVTLAAGWLSPARIEIALESRPGFSQPPLQ